MKNRMDRVNSEIKNALSEILTYEINDSALKGSFITIIKVVTSADLRHCKVFVSIFPDNNKQEKFFALLKTVHFIRKELAKKVQLRVVPEIQFELDDGIEYSAKINELINNIHKN